MRCPDCDGLGGDRYNDGLTECPRCLGDGEIEDDDGRDTDWIYDENVYLYSVPIGTTNSQEGD